MRSFTRDRVRSLVLITLGAIVFGCGAVAAATTISTNIQTDGTLSVAGTSTLAGNVGIATSTPGSPLSIGGIANFTAATSSFYGNGINLAAGCFAVNGTCVGGSSSKWATSGSNISYTGGNVGIGTTTPVSQLDLENWTVNSDGGTLTGGNPQFEINGTLDTTNTTGHVTGAQLYWNTNGTNGMNVNGMRIQLNAGYTGTGIARVVDIQNLIAGGDHLNSADVHGTLGASIESQGPSAGDNAGVYAVANGAAGYNVALLGRAYDQSSTGTDGTDIGVLGYAGHGGHGNNAQIGGWFAAGNWGMFWNGNDPINATTSAAVLADSNIAGVPILLGRSLNNIPAFTITSTGGIISTSTANATNFWQVLNSSGSSVLDIDTSNGRIGIGTTTPGSILSVGSVANWTSATSTYYSTGGLNLTGGGCFAINGTCVGGAASQWATSGSNISYTGGSVGIGTTTSPAGIFEVSQSVPAGRNFIYLTNSSGSSKSNAIVFRGLTSQFALINDLNNNGTRDFSIRDSAANAVRLYVDSTGDVQFAGSAADTNPAMFVGQNGNVGIGTTSPDMLLSVGSATPSGNVAHFENSTGSCYINPTTTSLSCSSDQRLKKDIEPIDASSTLAGVLALNPVSYNWLSEATASPPHTGFIAQQVLPIFPDLVSQGPDGYYTLNYAGFAPYIVEAVQQMYQELTSLENTIAGFAQSFTSHQVNTDELCVTKSDGTPVCITGDQLAALLAAEGSASSAPRQ